MKILLEIMTLSIFFLVFGVLVHVFPQIILCEDLGKIKYLPVSYSLASNQPAFRLGIVLLLWWF